MDFWTNLLGLVSLNDLILHEGLERLKILSNCFISGQEGHILGRKGLLIPWSGLYLQLKTWFKLHQDFDNVFHLIQQDCPPLATRVQHSCQHRLVQDSFLEIVALVHNLDLVLDVQVCSSSKLIGLL